MATPSKGMLERLSFMNKVVKNAGISAKEAVGGFRLFGEAMKNVSPMSKMVPEIWSEKLIDNYERDSFFTEYQQQPITTNMTNASTESVLTTEQLQKVRDRLAEQVEGQITNELMGTFDMTEEPSGYPDRCPSCMRKAEWVENQDTMKTICVRCEKEFDSLWLHRGNFYELRRELILRNEAEQERERAERRANDLRIAQSPPPSMEINDEIRALMAHRDLTANQMQRLSELIGIVQNSPPPRLHSAPDEYGNARGSAYSEHMLRRRLLGQGVRGDSPLMGNEESITFSGEDSVEVEDGFLTREIYEGLGFGGGSTKTKSKSIEPLKPTKRKLDI